MVRELLTNAREIWQSWFELQQAIINNPIDDPRLLDHALYRVRDKKKERLIHSLHYICDWLVAKRPVRLAECYNDINLNIQH